MCVIRFLITYIIFEYRVRNNVLFKTILPSAIYPYHTKRLFMSYNLFTADTLTVLIIPSHCSIIYRIIYIYINMNILLCTAVIYRHGLFFIKSQNIFVYKNVVYTRRTVMLNVKTNNLFEQRN